MRDIVVKLATSERFRDFVGDHGLQYGYMNDDLLAILDTEQGRDLLENTNNLFEVFKANDQHEETSRPYAAIPASE